MNRRGRRGTQRKQRIRVKHLLPFGFPLRSSASSAVKISVRLHSPMSISVRTMIKRMNTMLAALLVAMLASSVVPQQRKSVPASVNENAVRAHIKYLSDDLLEGRGTGA